MVPTSSNSAFDLRNSKLKEYSVEWDPRFLEEAVLRAAETRQVLGFRGPRNRLYEIQDPEQREAAFREFHSDWFERLDLGRGIWQALQEQPLIPTSTRACIVVHSRGSRDEGADLFVSPGGKGTGETEGRTVAIRLDPHRLLDEERLLAFLRHELFHIADMLDPIFGYEPQLPKGELGPAHERLLQDRYRVLWDIYIDGRQVHRNWAPSSLRERRLHEFTRTFPMLADRIEEAFSRFFNGTSLTHSDLVAFAINPVATLASVLDSYSSNLKFDIRNSNLPTYSRPERGERCPLCRFPTHVFETDAAALPDAVVMAIRGDFPAWDTAHGLCQQCADLYRARPRLTSLPAPALGGEGMPMGYQRTTLEGEPEPGEEV